jgi:hypothetical protein
MQRWLSCFRLHRLNFLHCRVWSCFIFFFFSTGPSACWTPTSSPQSPSHIHLDFLQLGSFRFHLTHLCFGNEAVLFRPTHIRPLYSLIYGWLLLMPTVNFKSLILTASFHVNLTCDIYALNANGCWTKAPDIRSCVYPTSRDRHELPTSAPRLASVRRQNIQLPHIPPITMGYHTPHPRPPNYHGPAVFWWIALLISEPCNCSYWWIFQSTIDRQCYHMTARYPLIASSVLTASSLTNYMLHAQLFSSSAVNQGGFWVPGHCGSPDNKAADTAALHGTLVL